MNFNHTFADFISFDDVVLASTLGTNTLTPEGVAMQYSIWQGRNKKESLDTVKLLRDSGAEFNVNHVTKMVEQHYEHASNVS